jgi:hypothetical protein
LLRFVKKPMYSDENVRQWKEELNGINRLDANDGGGGRAALTIFVAGSAVCWPSF